VNGVNGLSPWVWRSLWLQKESKNKNSWVLMEDNPYKLRMDGYSGKIYQKAVKAAFRFHSILSVAYYLSDQKETVESCAVVDPPSPELQNG
jgi:hydroxymethylpyrimidine/phosphomethylpyrimidine kinase / thiaminase